MIGRRPRCKCSGSMLQSRHGHDRVQSIEKGEYINVITERVSLPNRSSKSTQRSGIEWAGCHVSINGHGLRLTNQPRVWCHHLRLPGRSFHATYIGKLRILEWWK
jgi:hypothetical protein